MKKSTGIRFWAVIFWLLVWQLASMALDQEILLVSPLRVLARLGELMLTSDFYRSVFFSLGRIGAGFFLAVLLGTGLAWLSSRFSWIAQLMAPILLAVKSVPVASFIILALIWFSSRNLSVLISFLMVLPVIYTNVLEGIGALDQSMTEMARVFSIPLPRRIRYIYLPQVFPYFQAACRVSLGLCWKSGIAAEVIGIPEGSMGERLQQAKVYLDTPDLFAWTVTIVLVSLAFEKIISALLKRGVLLLERM